MKTNKKTHIFRHTISITITRAWTTSQPQTLSPKEVVNLLALVLWSLSDQDDINATPVSESVQKKGLFAQIYKSF